MQTDHIADIANFLKLAESTLDKKVLDEKELSSLNKEADKLVEKIGQSRSYFKRLL